MGIISAAGTVTYKRRSGQTMKDALIERWNHNRHNPMDLEAFSGVEISLCTRNARKRRLPHLLGSPTMYYYLRGNGFKWIPHACENSYFKALRSPKLFRQFWKGYPDYRDNIGDAISLNTACLDFDHNGYGRRRSRPQPADSKSKGYAVLETSLRVNESMLGSIKLKSKLLGSGRTVIWNAKELKKGPLFSLGDQGILKVLTPASRTCPVIMEWARVKSEAFQEVKNVAINEKLLGENKDRHHSEHIRGK